MPAPMKYGHQWYPSVFSARLTHGSPTGAHDYYVINQEQAKGFMAVSPWF
jgi:hypothetical protein